MQKNVELFIHYRGRGYTDFPEISSPFHGMKLKLGL